MHTDVRQMLELTVHALFNFNEKNRKNDFFDTKIHSMKYLFNLEIVAVILSCSFKPTVSRCSSQLTTESLCRR